MSREHVHLIGIGGTGMSALAELLHEAGCRVTGSDQELYPPTSDLLKEVGLEVGVGFDAGRLRPAPDLVVIGNAIRRGNPEAEEVLDRRLRHASMPQVLAERFLDGRHSIVVAGTHGKTTTASMLAWVLSHAGADPGFLIGGLPRNFPRPSRRGSGPAFVVEGDEYDTAFFDKGPKFMHYRPDTAIIGTVEFDHADIYRDLDEVKRAFARFVNIVPRRGLVVRHEDDEVTREVTAAALSRIEGFGIRAGSWRAEQIESGPSGTRFVIARDGRSIAPVLLPMDGEHNVRNALAVAAAASEQGLAIEAIASGLASFKGVRRRLEVRGEARGVTVVDDFAHHPTAIRETLRAVRSRWPGRRVWALLEPRSWSLRRNVFQERLPAAFDDADEVIVAAVYGAEALPAESRLDPDRLVADLASRGRRARFLAGPEAIAEEVAARAAPGDVVVILSNGGFGGLHVRLLDRLAFNES